MLESELLSNMESSEQIPPAAPPTPDEAAAALREAQRASRSTMTGLVLPKGDSLMRGSANAVYASGVAVAVSDWRFGRYAFFASLLVVLCVAFLSKRRFRRRNGAWVHGFNGPRATWRPVAAFVVVLVVSIVGATALMVTGHPVLSAAVAGLALPLTVVTDRWWMAAYRAAGAGA